MAYKKMKIPLLEPEHYLGWALVTGAIILVFHLLGIHSLHSPWYNVLILYITLIIVDTLNHIMKLQ